MMDSFTLRPIEPTDRWEIAELICVSTNFWYQTHGRPPIFSGGAATTLVFFDVYQALDPGCGVVAVDRMSGRLAGSCFYHPRPTHVSLGIMNVNPNHFGSGVAANLLRPIIELADAEGQPLRLVSSAMNLDSFSLYTRAGFVPQAAYQDMLFTVPPDGLPAGWADFRLVREAVLADVPDMVALEMEVAGISRAKDFQYFLENRDGFWHTSVLRNARGELEGFLASCGHRGCNMIGPGAALTPEVMLPLLAAELDRHRGRTPVLLMPVLCAELVQTMYRWGARNCETHFGQVRGAVSPIHGVHIPTFLPESA
jgi:RimJ/RimL family protein N-acetyltransferase